MSNRASVPLIIAYIGEDVAALVSVQVRSDGALYRVVIPIDVCSGYAFDFTKALAPFVPSLTIRTSAVDGSCRGVSCELHDSRGVVFEIPMRGPLWAFVPYRDFNVTMIKLSFFSSISTTF